MRRLRRWVFPILITMLVASPDARAATRFAEGSFIGDGTATRAIADIGFRPDLVLVVGENNEAAMVRTTTMPAGLSKPIGPNDPLVVSGIVSLDADGFTIGAEKAVNEPGITFYWFALQGSPGLLHFGSYTGNGVDLRPIEVGLAPVYAVVMAENNDQAMQRFVSQVGEGSLPFDNSDAKTDRIEAFTDSGFLLGKHNTVNEDGRGYHWFAFADDPLSVTTGTYVGDETSPRAIAPLAFGPEGVLVKADSGAEGNALRIASMITASSMPVDGGTMLPETILDLYEAGFDVGSSKRVNENGKSIFWVTLRDTPHADLSLELTVDDDAPAEGDTIVFDLRLQNLGPAPASGIAVNFSIPEGLSLVSRTVTSGSYDAAGGRWNLPSLAVDATSTLRVAATVDDGTAARTVTVGADVAALDQVDTNAMNDTAQASVVVADLADLQVATIVAPGAIEEGDSFETVVSIFNAGPARASNVTGRLDLPDGLAYVNDAPDRGWYDSGTGSWTVGDIEPGGTVSLRVNGRPDVGSAGTTFALSASASTESPDPDAANDSDTADLRVRAADMSVAVDPDVTTANAGDTVVWSVTVTDTGPDDARAVFVKLDSAPELSDSGSLASQGSFSSATGVWDVGAIAVGDTARLELTTLVVTERGDVEATVRAEVSSASVDPDPSDDVATGTIRVPSSNLGIELAFASPVANPGEELSLTVTATNAGPDDATGAAVDLVLPPSLSSISAVPSHGSFDAPSARWTIGDLSAGGSAELMLDLQLTSGTEGTSPSVAASIGAAVDDPDATDDSAAVVLDVLAVDLGIDLTVNNLAPDEGEVLTYTITLDNAGPDEATGVTVRTDLPTGTTFQSAVPGQGNYDPGTGLWNADSLASGAVATLALIATVDAGTAGSSLTSEATVVAVDQVDTEPANDVASVTATVFSADLAVSSLADTTTPDEGDTVTVRVDVANLGPKDVTGVVVSAPLVAGLDFLTAIASVGVFDAPSAQWNVGALAESDTATLELVYRIAAGSSGTTIVHAASVIASSLSDPVPDNDSAQSTITVFSADIAVAVRGNGSSANEGDEVRFVVGVENLGPNVATGVTVAASLTSGLEFVSSVPSTGTHDPVSAEWQIPSLAPGTVDSLVIEASVAPGTGGRILATIADLTASDLVDPVPENDGGRAEIRVRSLDLETSLTSSVASANAGDRVDWALTVVNRGPDVAATSITELVLPPALVLDATSASHGAFDPTASRWTFDTLDVDSTAVLEFATTVGDTPAGARLDVEAVRATTLPVDLDTTNDDAMRSLHIETSDLVLETRVDVNEAEIGQSVTFAITLANRGPDPATSIVVLDTLPDGLTLSSTTVEVGNYDATAGRWEVPTLGVGATRSLELVASIDPGTSGETLVNGAAVVAVDQADPVAGDTQATASVVVRSADLAITGDVTSNSLEPDATTTATFRLKNRGPGQATSISVELGGDPRVLFVPGELVGTWTDETSTWTIDTLSSGSTAELNVDVRIAPEAGPGPAQLTASIAAIDQLDPDATNDTTQIAVEILPSRGALAVTSTRVGGRLVPGADPVTILSLELTNSNVSDDTLKTLRLVDASTIAGTAEQRDASWQRFVLLDSHDQRTLAITTLVDGRVEFSGLDVPVAAGGAVDLAVSGGASFLARDGDQLDVVLPAAEPMVFVSGDTLGSRNGDPLPAYDVDGSSAAQIRMIRFDAEGLRTGLPRQKVLEVILPANGYEADALEKLNLVQYGTARASTLDGPMEIEGLEAWADDGDGLFDPSRDARLGPFSFTGDRWELTGLSHPIPTTGLRVVVSANIEPGAEVGRTVELGLPGPPDPGIGVASGNDGPIDRAPDSAPPLSISAVDRITVAAGSTPPNTVAPGATIDAALELVLGNSYSDARTVTRLEIENATEGTGSQSQLDASFELLTLRLDGNGDGGIDDTATDPVLGTGAFENGRIVFDGLELTLDAGVSRILLVQARVSSEASDPDRLQLRVAGTSAIDFTQPTRASGTWPVVGGTWTVDGMVAAQIGIEETGSETLGAFDGPALALDLTIPPNGYRDDVLRGLRVRNVGTATADDLAEFRLWRDGGDGEFDAGAGDDRNLGPLAPLAATWQSALLDEPLTVGSANRFFVGVHVGAAPVDSSTLRLEVPVGGINVESDHDGPIHSAVVTSSTRLLSAAPLLASLSFDRTRSVVGTDVHVQMVVRNAGTESLIDVLPTNVTVEGNGSMVLTSGPAPTSVDLAPGASDTLRWTWTATGAGTVRVRAGASAFGSDSGLQRRALQATSPDHVVSVEATTVDLVPVSTPATRVTQGQSGFVPLSFSFDHGSGAGASDIALHRIELRFEDENADAIDAGDLLETAIVAEGRNEYARTSALTEGDSTIVLDFSPPVVVTTDEPVTLSMRLDLSSTTTVRSFRVALEAAASVGATDAVSGAPVAVVIDGSPPPVRSGLVTVQAEVTELQLAVATEPGAHAPPGATDVPLLRLDAENPGVGGLTADIEIERIEVRVVDADGHGVLHAADFLGSLTLESSGLTVADAHVDASLDSILTLDLSPRVRVAVDTPTVLRFSGSIPSTASPGTFSLRVSATGVRAVDGTARREIPVVVGTDPLQGPDVTIEHPASEARILATGGLAPTTIIGSRGVEGLRFHLRHPGDRGVAAVDLDTLTVAVQDERRSPLTFDALFDVVRIRRDGEVVASLSDFSSVGDRIVVALDGVGLGAGDTLDLAIDVDVDAAAPDVHFEIWLPAAGTVVRDRNDASPVAVLAESGTELPLGSGASRLRPPAREVTVDLRSNAPAAVVPGEANVEFADLVLRNPSAEGGTVIELRSFDVHVSDRDGRRVEPTRAFTALRAAVDDSAVAVQGIPDASTGTTRFHFDPPLVVAAGAAATLRLQGDLAEDARLPGVRLEIDADGLDVEQPAGALLGIDVVAVPGRSFPMRTESANLSVRGLAESFANFPNPFAAGRATTNFVYHLTDDGEVTLRVYTVTGEEVATLLDGDFRPAGLHQDDTWDGRNGRGEPVRNGVYLARIEVRFARGQTEERLHKIAVVR